VTIVPYLVGFIYCVPKIRDIRRLFICHDNWFAGGEGFGISEKSISGDHN
jgi:hypothetical protein